MPAGRVANWAGNVVFGAARLHRPRRISELQRLVAASKRVRAVGTGHSFTAIADTAGDLLCLADLPAVLSIDAERATVTVAAGVTYARLARHLHQAGYALGNLASLTQISVAGACTTGTHGSGDGNGSLATAVAGLRMVTADGDLVSLRRGVDDEFDGSVVALGALGIVTSLTLDIVPSFMVRQYVYDDLPGQQFAEHLASIFASGYSVSVFTRWRPPLSCQVWLKELATDTPVRLPAPTWHGARLADRPRHPVPGLPPENCTPQLGVPGPWHERLPHFGADATPSVGEELQSEYLLPREHAVAAVRAISAVADQVAGTLAISEIRTVAADGLWLSPSYGRETVALHFTWRNDPAAVARACAVIEERLARFGPRPHWGKLSGIDRVKVAASYQRLPDFQRLRHRYDPAGKFGNDWLDSYLAAG